VPAGRRGRSHALHRSRGVAGHGTTHDQRAGANRTVTRGTRAARGSRRTPMISGSGRRCAGSRRLGPWGRRRRGVTIMLRTYSPCSAWLAVDPRVGQGHRRSRRGEASARSRGRCAVSRRCSPRRGRARRNTDRKT
jgi:hypothetical protein